MLVQFSVENYRSLRDKTVLSMLASADERHPEHVCTVAGGLRVLRCALLYGANASGKSNVVKALWEAAWLIENGIRPGNKLPVAPFRLVSGKPSPETRFEFEVVLGERRYSYGISVSAKRVESEWLFVTENSQEQMYFERSLPKAGAAKTEIRLGDVYGEQRQRVEFVAQGTRPEQPFLTEADEREVEQLKPLVHWFREQLNIINPDTPYLGLAVHAQADDGFRRFLVDMLSIAGTGVDGLKVESEGPPSDDENWIRSLKEIASDSQRRAEIGRVLVGKGGGLHLTADERPELVKLLTTHTVGTEKSVDLELAEESDGTVRLLHLTPILYSLRPGQIPELFIIDELDRSLHPLLTRMFLQRFLALGSGSPGQLICTTHDTNLLSLALLRPDEIWFVEKDAEKVSHLYSLAEFKPEQLEKLGDNLEQGYLNGRFGAIPFFGNPSQLGISKDGEAR